MPSLLVDISVVSARDYCCDPAQPLPWQWKLLAFADLYDDEVILIGPVKQIISIGDSVNERRALMEMQRRVVEGTILKSLKLPARPNVESLINGLKIITGSIRDVAGFDANLDLHVK